MSGEAPTVIISSPATGPLSRGGWSRQAERQILTEATTLKEADWVPPLPPKYKTALDMATAPELVLWEMFKRTLELRSLLEVLVASLPIEWTNDEIEQAEVFLRSHCAGCGEVTPQAEDGSPPVCAACQYL
jgi:hypothetical protein